MPRAVVLSLRIGLLLVCAATPLAAQTNAIRVPAGGDLQAAIDRAKPGDVILLAAGASFVGNFVLPATPGAKYITIRSDADPSRFPATERVAPSHGVLMPVLRSPNTFPALATAPGAHHWRLQWLRFEANLAGIGDIITLGDGSAQQRTLNDIPHHLILDGLIIRGDPQQGQKRAIALNSASTTIRNSDIRDIKAPGQDSQAICGWNGPGPFLIENNYLEAAGENVMFGGADPSVPGLVPSDITFRRNYVTKPLSWREPENARWTVKNLFELKNAQRVLIEWNLFEHSWQAAQSGYAILFTPLNQDHSAPWTVVSDVTFQYNVVRHASAGVNMLGYDYMAPSRQTRRITIRENLFYDIDASRWGGDGRFFLIGDEPADILLDHNTVLQSGPFMVLYGQADGAPRPVKNLRVTNNLALHNEVGIFGDALGSGQVALDAYMPDGVLRYNVLAGGDASRYPAQNFFPAPSSLMNEFVNAAAADFRLKATSPFRTSGGNGSTVGANVEVLRRGLPRASVPGPR